MAHYDLEEQEQLAQLKAWWQTYGNMISTAALILALAALAYNTFNWFQNKNAAEAAAIYQQFNAALTAKDSARVASLAGELIDKYPSQSYATLAAMEAGAFSFNNADKKTAQMQLTWAAEKGSNDFKDVAQLRLANFLLNEKELDKALQTLGTPQNARFAPAFFDLKGDIYLAKNDAQNALTAWQTAQSKIQSDPSFNLAFAALNESISQKIAAISPKIEKKITLTVENEPQPSKDEKTAEKSEKTGDSK